MRCRTWALLVSLAILVLGPVAGWAADDPGPPLSRIAFGSCARQDRDQPIWEAVVATQPELFLFLGDNIYADTEDMEVMRQKYAQLAAKPGFQKLRQTCRLLATWDDHDYGADDIGAEYPKKAESQQVFLDFWGVPKDSPRRQRPGVYDAHVFGPPGKQVQIILLDTRYFRSPLKKKSRPVKGQGNYVPNPDPEATILGAAQWQWLEEQLRVPAQVRLLCSSIQLVAEDHGYEKWMNFPRERERLYNLIRDTKAAGVVILSGDRHLAELSLMDAGIGYPLYDLTSSGLNQGFKGGWRKLEENHHRVATMNVGDNFGQVLIDWDRPEPRLRLVIRDVEGDITIQQKLSLSVLQPSAKRMPAAEAGGLAAEAARHEGQEYTVEMQVRSAGKAQKRVFLNSEADFKSPKNFTVVLDDQAQAKFRAAQIDDPGKHFRGKTVRVTGTVTLFQKHPQIVVSDPKQIQVVDK